MVCGLSIIEEFYVWIFSDQFWLIDGVWFFINFVEFMMNFQSWVVWFDGGIENLWLFFFGYKKMIFSDGWIIFLDVRYWFDGEVYDFYC